MGMLYAAIDIHGASSRRWCSTGQRRDRRGAFPATREALREWALPLRGTVAAVAVEATCGWRRVWRELCALGFEVRLAEPAQTRRAQGPQAQAEDRPSRCARETPRQPSTAGLAAPALGARPGRPARRPLPRLKPERRPLPRRQETDGQPTRRALDRAQDRKRAPPTCSRRSRTPPESTNLPDRRAPSNGDKRGRAPLATDSPGCPQVE